MQSSRGGRPWYYQPREELEQHTTADPRRRDQERRLDDRADYRGQWRHEDPGAMRYTDVPHDLHAARLAPPRVAELRGRRFPGAAMEGGKTASPIGSPVQSPHLRRHPMHDYEERRDVAEWTRHQRQSWQGDTTNSLERTSTPPRARAESDEAFHQETTTSAMWYNDMFQSNDRGSGSPYAPGSAWGSPSSISSSLDGSSHLLDQLSGWKGLHVGDSPGEASPRSDSAVRVHQDGKAEGPAKRSESRATQPAPAVKQSRYLREMDRRIILSRLAKGERQAALAKEYGVSRSTICNLLKQKDLVLARKDENPLSRHPKKTRLLRSKHPAPPAPVSARHETAPFVPQHADAATRPPSRKTSQASELEHKTLAAAEPPIAAEFLSFDRARVIEAQSRAISLLKTKLLNRETSDDDFKRCHARLMRLLMEEAIGIVSAPAHKSGFDDPNNTSGGNQQLILDRAAPLVDSLCAVAIGESGTPLLDVFRLLEPEVSTGFIGASLRESGGLELHIVSHTHDLRDRNVLLLDVVLASSDSACAAIDLLRSTGVQDERITIVALFVAAEVVALVQYAHPHVRILTAGIDVQLHQRVGTGRHAADSTSSSRAFLDRFVASSR